MIFGRGRGWQCPGPAPRQTPAPCAESLALRVSLDFHREARMLSRGRRDGRRDVAVVVRVPIAVAMSDRSRDDRPSRSSRWSMCCRQSPVRRAGQSDCCVAESLDQRVRQAHFRKADLQLDQVRGGGSGASQSIALGRRRA